MKDAKLPRICSTVAEKSSVMLSRGIGFQFLNSTDTVHAIISHDQFIGLIWGHSGPLSVVVVVIVVVDIARRLRYSLSLIHISEPTRPY